MVFTLSPNKLTSSA